MKIEVCPYCNEEVKHFPPDGVSVCSEHGTVEGNTILIEVEDE